MCISRLPRTLLILLLYCLSIWLFRNVFFGCHILVQNRLVLHLVGIFLCHLLPEVGRIFFRCFGMSSFVSIVLSFVGISLIFLHSPVLSGLFPQVILLFFLALPFPFCSIHVPVSFLCFIILACFRRFFFICVSSRNFKKESTF